MNTVIDILDDRAKEFAERDALVTKTGLRLQRWTYQELWQAGHAAARHFRDSGKVRRGDRVLVMAPNGPEVIASFIGGWLAGAVLVPLDPFSSVDFVDRVIGQTAPAAMITPRPGPEGFAVQRIFLEEIPFHARESEITERPGEADIAEIVFTSGTTGTPKGVVLSHGNIAADTLALARVVPTRTDWRLLSLLPLSHMFEQTVGHFTTLHKGGTIYYPGGLSSAAVIKAFQRHRIVAIVAVPALTTHLLRAIEREVRSSGNWSRWERAHRLAARLPFAARRYLFRQVHRRLGGTFRFIISGGARLQTAVAETWQRLGIRVIEGYGVTECAPVISTNRFDDPAAGSVGCSLPGIRVRLSNEGEIQVSGANVMTGYWRNRDATRSALTPDGWYRTGDLGEMDETGRLYIKGRIKEMIVLSSGLNVFPEDIETVLAQQEGIQECVVVGNAEGTGADRLTALIVPSAPVEDPVDAQRHATAAVKAANLLLAPYQRITDVRIWPQRLFPRTAMGKVKRHEVRRTLETGKPPSPETRTTGADTVLGRLRRILGDLADIPSERIGKDSHLDLDLNLSSLGRVELAVALGDEFGIEVEDGDIVEIESVGQLIELVERGQARETPVTFPDWSLRAPAQILRALLQFGLLLPLHALVARPFRVVGRENLAGLDFPVLFVSNHCSHMDTIAIIRALPFGVRRRTTIAAAADYFYRDPVRGAAASVILNTFPFSRGGAVRATLEHCGDLIDGGWSVLVYPEGTRSTTGKLLPFKSGAGFLAKGLNVSIVPIAVRGGFDILPKGRTIPRPGPMTVKFGRAVPAYGDDHPDNIARHLHDLVARLQSTLDAEV